MLAMHGMLMLVVVMFYHGSDGGDDDARHGDGVDARHGSRPMASQLTVRVRMSDGSVKRVQAKARDTVEDVCERVRSYFHGRTWPAQYFSSTTNLKSKSDSKYGTKTTLCTVIEKNVPGT